MLQQLSSNLVNTLDSTCLRQISEIIICFVRLYFTSNGCIWSIFVAVFG